MERFQGRRSVFSPTPLPAAAQICPDGRLRIIVASANFSVPENLLVKGFQCCAAAVHAEALWERMRAV